MIKYIGDTTHTELYPCESFDTFKEWANSLKGYIELDTETNVTDDLTLRELVCIQFGYNDTEWVLQWSYLTDSQKKDIKDILEGDLIWIAHYSTFEYTLLRKYDIKLKNVWDTLLAEQVLTCGLDSAKKDGFYSLREVAYRRLGEDLDKSMQLAFGENILTDEHIEYAAKDVSVMHSILMQQYEELSKEDTLATANLENRATLSFGDMCYNGMLVDTKAWIANIDLATPIIDESKKELDSIILSDDKAREFCLTTKSSKGLPLLIDENTLVCKKLDPKSKKEFYTPHKWNSPANKKTLLKLMFPDWEDFSTKGVEKLGESKSGDLVDAVMSKNYDLIESIIFSSDAVIDYLKGLDLLFVKGRVNVNWASPKERLGVMQTRFPELECTKIEALDEYRTDNLINSYIHYNDAEQLKTKFGIRWLDNLDSDGRVRTKFNQVLSTGRVSSSSPNMQQIPAKEPIGNRYRNTIIAPQDWVFCSSDYSSQELAVIAHLSQDPVWLKALEEGKDLHSVCASLVHKDKWDLAGLGDCAFLKKDIHGNSQQLKCKCPEHKKLRTDIKSVNFGLAYGITAPALASLLGISTKEATTLMEEYFITFPKIEKYLHGLRDMGMKQGFIKNALNRKRYFEYHKVALAAFNKGSKGALNAIGRASSNMPIQGTSADMTKIALILVRDYLNTNQLNDKVKLVMTVHDQVDTIVHVDYALTWRIKLTNLMEEAAKFIIPTGILKADTEITLKWSKGGQDITEELENKVKSKAS